MNKRNGQIFLTIIMFLDATHFIKRYWNPIIALKINNYNYTCPESTRILMAANTVREHLIWPLIFQIVLIVII